MGKRPPTLSQRVKRADDGVFAIGSAVMTTSMVAGFAGVFLIDIHPWLGIILVAPIVLVLVIGVIGLFVAMWVWAYREWRKHGS